MRNKLLIVLLVIFILNMTSCKKEIDRIHFSFKDLNKIEITDYKFYQKDGKSIFLYIVNDTQRNILKSKPINSIEIKNNSSVFKGKVIEAAFSREVDLKPFICYTYNDGYISFEDINDLELLYIGAKVDLKSLIDSEIIKTPIERI